MPVACEKAKMQINQRIEGVNFETLFQNDEFFESEYELSTNVFGEDDWNVPKLSTWLESINQEAKKMVIENDDGNRDNILENHAFAEHFLRLCKLLPLWCGMSCQFFSTPHPVGSSWQSETWYKNLKQMHGDHIPCSVDEFIGRDLTLINAHVILASRQYSTTGRKKSKMVVVAEYDEGNGDISELVDDPESGGKSSENHTVDKLQTNNQNNHQSNRITSDHCVACKRGDKPSGLHKCVSCSKAIHILDGCSVDIGEDEGCGQKKICMSCYGTNTKQQMAKQAIKEKNYTDVWSRKNRKQIKHSKYMETVPNWNLFEVQSKVKIGHLINGNKIHTPHTVNGERVKLQNTCALDSVIQLLAASYAYNTSFKSFVEVHTKDGIFQIVKLLAMK